MSIFALVLASFMLPSRGFAIDCSPNLAQEFNFKIIESLEDREAIGRRVLEIMRQALSHAEERNWHFTAQTPPTWPVSVHLKPDDEWLNLKYTTNSRSWSGSTEPLFRVNRVTGELQVGDPNQDRIVIPISMRLDIANDKRSFVLTMDWAERVWILAMKFKSQAQLVGVKYRLYRRTEDGRLQRLDRQEISREKPPTRFTLPEM